MEHFWNNFFSVFGFISGLIFTAVFFHALNKAIEKIRRHYISESADGSQNSIQNFLDEWCRKDPQAEITAQNLYNAYAAWCKEKGDEPLAQTRFGRHMAAMDFKRVCRGPCSYIGLELNEAAKAKIQPGQ